MHRINREFIFDSEATTIATPVMQVMTNRRGVCQDFAHLQVGCLRSLGLPARYVSGYLVTHPVPGQPRLVGADASHAWLSVWCPRLGWVDLDPTNDVLPSSTPRDSSPGAATTATSARFAASCLAAATTR